MPGPHGGTVSVLGPCSYCETPTRDTCRLCGRAICPDHAVEGELVCLACGERRADD
ncbi:MAG: hypothetical protein ACYDCK_08760 [Thermoplasmatota archaeon]